MSKDFDVEVSVDDKGVETARIVYKKTSKKQDESTETVEESKSE